jgi:hypothetical protein
MTSPINSMRPIFKYSFKKRKMASEWPGFSRRQGVETVQKRSVHEVREHFEAFRNAAFG